MSCLVPKYVFHYHVPQATLLSSRQSEMRISVLLFKISTQLYEQE